MEADSQESALNIVKQKWSNGDIDNNTEDVINSYVTPTRYLEQHLKAFGTKL